MRILRQLAMSLVLVFSQAQIFASGADNTPAGSLVVVQPADIKNFDPADSTSSTTDRTFQYLIYDSLVTWDKDLRPRPNIATSWRISPDMKTWTFKLNPKARFADNTPVTAVDVKFTIERVLDPKTRAGRRTSYTVIKSVEAPDPQTVMITTEAPFPDLLQALADGSVHILSRDFVTRWGANYGRSVDATLGSGPYRVASWAPGQGVVVEPNPNYWGTPAKLSGIKIVPVAEGTVRAAYVRTGGADIVNDVPPEEIEPLKRVPGFQLLKEDSGQQMAVELNVTKPPLNDIRVRQALRYAIDYNAIIKTILGGLARVAVSPTGPVADRGVFAPWPFDASKARQLIRDAGADGAQISLYSPTGQYLNGTEFSQAIQAYWSQIGLRVQLSLIDWDSFLAVQTSASDRMAAVVGRTGPYLDFNLWRLYHTSETLSPQVVLYKGYNNKQVDELLQMGRQSFNPTLRKRYYADAQKIIWDESPFVWLWTWNNVIAVRQTVQDFVWLPTDRMYLSNVWKRTN